MQQAEMPENLLPEREKRELLGVGFYGAGRLAPQNNDKLLEKFFGNIFIHGRHSLNGDA